MFSLDKFYYILHNNLISNFNESKSVYFYPFGTYNGVNILRSNTQYQWYFQLPNHFHCYFFDQEPYYESTRATLANTFNYLTTNMVNNVNNPNGINIIANSEKSTDISQFIKSQNSYDWYYFFHGFAALDWYRDFQYVNRNSFIQFDKVFICFNNLTSNLRSYRLHLVSNLIDQDLVQYGAVSLPLKDQHGTWQKTISDPRTPLDNRARVKIYKTLKNVSAPLTIDTATPTGELSAKVELDQLTSALWHVVTETVYFLPKLHLTEKIFKPIVAQRPFILVAAPGNLAYLKSYGFRTFDQWIDESYDAETDHYVRIEKITAELNKLCAKSSAELRQMHAEMQEVLEYNFNHFYNEFKNTIVNELVDNFASVLNQINHGRIPNNHSEHHTRYELDPTYLAEVKKRLSQ